MTLIPKTYNLLVEAIEDGVDCGWRRAEKHADQTAFELAAEHCPDDIWFAKKIDYREAIYDAVLNAILEKFHLTEGEESRDRS